MSKFKAALMATLITSSMAWAHDVPPYMAVPYASPYGGLSYHFTNYRDGGSTVGYSFLLGNRFTQNFSADVLAELDENGDRVRDGRIDLGLIPSVDVGPAQFYLRIAGGGAVVAPGTVTYYSIEPGLRFSMVRNATLTLGYRYRSYFGSDRERAWVAGAEYSFNENLSLTLGYDRYASGYRSDTYKAGFKVHF